MSDPNKTEEREPVGSSAWLGGVNRERDSIARSQKGGPDGLMYPILSLCCYYAESESVHRSCLQAMCVCPCHKPPNDKVSDRR